MLILRELFGLVSALAPAAALGAADATTRGFLSDARTRGGSLSGAALGGDAGTATTGWATGAGSGAGTGPGDGEEATGRVALTGSRGSTAMGVLDCRPLT